MKHLLIRTQPAGLKLISKRRRVLPTFHRRYDLPDPFCQLSEIILIQTEQRTFQHSPQQFRKSLVILNQLN